MKRALRRCIVGTKLFILFAIPYLDYCRLWCGKVIADSKTWPETKEKIVGRLLI